MILFFTVFMLPLGEISLWW